jgi:hypothetical protein
MKLGSSLNNNSRIKLEISISVVRHFWDKWQDVAYSLGMRNEGEV